MMESATERSGSEDATRSHLDSEQQSGFADSTMNVTQTVTNGISQDVSRMNATKHSWIFRFCSDPVFRQNVCESIAVELVVVSMGWIYAMVGPSLPDLQIISGMTLQEASWLFTGFAIGYIIGCAAAGLLLIRVSARALLALAGIIAAVAVGILPLITNGYVMIAMRFVGGIAFGLQDTTGTVRLFDIWGSAGGSWIQMVYCTFSIGGIISPLVLKPFLAQTLTSNAGVNVTDETGFDVTQTTFENTGFNVTASPDTSTVSTFDGVISTVNQFLTTESAIAPTMGKSNIHYAYLISALVSVLTAVPFIMYYLKDRLRTKNSKPSKQVSAGDNEINANRLPCGWKYTLLTLMCLGSLLGTGYIDAFPNYLTSFGILQLGATKEDGSFATSIYFTSMAVGNLVGVIGLRYMSSGKYITISHVVTSMSHALYYISVRLPLTKPLQWTFIAMSSVGVSAVVPTLYTWTQDNVTPVSGLVASCYLVFGSIGTMVTPLFLGYLIENITPMWFMYTMFLYEGGCIVLFVAATITLMYFGRRTSSRSSRDNNGQINPAFQTDVNVDQVKIHYLYSERL